MTLFVTLLKKRNKMITYSRNVEDTSSTNEWELQVITALCRSRLTPQSQVYSAVNRWVKQNQGKPKPSLEVVVLVPKEDLTETSNNCHTFVDFMEHNCAMRFGCEVNETERSNLVSFKLTVKACKKPKSVAVKDFCIR